MLRAKVISLRKSFLVVRPPPGMPREEVVQTLAAYNRIAGDINPSVTVVSDDSGADIEAMTQEELAEYLQGVLMECGRMYLRGYHARAKEDPARDR